MEGSCDLEAPISFSESWNSNPWLDWPLDFEIESAILVRMCIPKLSRVGRKTVDVRLTRAARAEDKERDQGTEQIEKLGAENQ